MILVGKNKGSVIEETLKEYGFDPSVKRMAGLASDIYAEKDDGGMFLKVVVVEDGYTYDKYVRCRVYKIKKTCNGMVNYDFSSTCIFNGFIKSDVEIRIMMKFLEIDIYVPKRQ